MRLLPVALAALAVTAATRPAGACWDGDAASVGGVSMIYGSHADWEPAVVIERARWLGRIDRALPPDTDLIVDNISAVCTGDPCGGFESHHGENALAAVLRDVRRAFPRVKPRPATTTAPLTIQIFAGDAPAARAIADRVAAADDHSAWHGFYEAGGFPADNSPAHVLRAHSAHFGAVHRVVVGAFLTRAGADAVLRSLAAAGFHGFVRPLAGAGAPA